MPKPTPKKHTFDAQVQSALGGTRILPQAERAEHERSARNGKTNGQPSQPEISLVEKLIDFLKTMD
jgi:hypothetical protein